MKFRHLFVVCAIGTTLLVAACGKQDTILDDPTLVNTGDVVTVDYTLTRSDGKIFATTVSGAEVSALGTDSLEREIDEVVIAGDDHVLWGEAIVGQHLDDVITVTVEPQTSGNEQYYNENKVQYISASALGITSTPTIGDVYDIGGQRAWITALSGSGDDQIITFDLNARETWDSYTYEVVILDVVNQ